eukprot:scaffold2.g7229.t1
MKAWPRGSARPSGPLERNFSQSSLLPPSPRGLALRRLRCVLLGLLALLACGTAWWRLGAARPLSQYVLVIDAGSSGTRLLAYRWEAPAARGAAAASAAAGVPRLTPVPPAAAAAKIPRRALGKRRAYSRVETEPGLDAFVMDRAGLEARALAPLLDWAQAALPSRAWAQTPLFLFGTAGLRRLAPGDRGQVLDAAREVLAGSAFRFEDSWARVLEGEDEGVFGWVALNYMQARDARVGSVELLVLEAERGTLAPAGLRQEQERRLGEAAAGETVGALDLGGSSLEVSFAAEQAAPESDRKNVSVLGANHSLYCHVHHHYGLNDAFERSVAMLLQRPPPAERVPAASPISSAGGQAASARPEGGNPAGQRAAGHEAHTRGGEGEASSSSGQDAAHKVAPKPEHHGSDVHQPGSHEPQSGHKLGAQDSSAQAEAQTQAQTQHGDSDRQRTSEGEQHAEHAVPKPQGHANEQHGSAATGLAHASTKLLAVPEALRRRLAGVLGPLPGGAGSAPRQGVAATQRAAAEQAQWLQQELLAEERRALPGPAAALRHGQRRLAGAASEQSAGGGGGGGGGGGRPEERRAARGKAAAGGALSALPEHRGDDGLPALREVAHPCLHEGYRQRYHRLVIDDTAPSPLEVLLVGRPDFGACARLASAVVNSSAAHCPHCALSAPQPATAGRRFVALAGFYVVYHFLGLPTTASLDQIQEAGRAFCAMPWKQVARERAGEIHIDRYCFRRVVAAPYIAALLTEGLKLKQSQIRIGSPDVSWTLGAALVEGYRLGGLSRGDGMAAVRISAAAWLPHALARQPGRAGWAAGGAAAGLAGCAAWWRRRRRLLPGRSLKRRHTEDERGVAGIVGGLALDDLLPLASPPPLGAATLGRGASAAALRGGPFGSGSLSPPRAPPPAPGSPLQELGAKLFAASRSAKRRSQSWSADAALANGGSLAFGTGHVLVSRGSQTFSRRKVDALAEGG